MAKFTGWNDLTKEEKKLAQELGLTGTKYQGKYAVTSHGEDNPDWTGIRPLLQDEALRTEFLNEFSGMQGSDLTGAWGTWNAETPIRQQERTASATLDLSMENIPEIIAGGTARAAQGKKQRRPANSTSPIVTALGLGIEGPAPTARPAKDWLSLGIM